MYISRVLDVNYSSHCFILCLGTDRIGDVGIHSTSNEGFVNKRAERRINRIKGKDEWKMIVLNLIALSFQIYLPFFLRIMENFSFFIFPLFLYNFEPFNRFLFILFKILAIQTQSS